MTNEPKHINILDKPQVVEERAEDAISTQLSKKLGDRWKKAVIDPAEYLDPKRKFTPPDWAISIHGTNVFAFDDYNYLQGQAGNGKTFTMCVYEAVIAGAKFGDLRYIGNREKPKILHIDTEQSEGNVQLHSRRVYHLAGWEQGSDHSDQYRVLMLRETPNPLDRLDKIVKSCYEFRPDFLFIDGMLDVVDGMNKEENCNMVISEVGTMASILKMCIVGICHENPSNPKAKDEGGPPKPAGHIGSYSQRKGSAGQGTIKHLNGTTASFYVSPKKVRNKDYEGWWFGVQDTPIVIDGQTYTIGIPYWIDGETAASEEESEEQMLINRALGLIKGFQWSIEGKTRTELDKDLTRAGITSNRMRTDFITYGINAGVLSQPAARGRYYLVYDNGNMDTQTNFDNNSLGDDKGAPF